MSPQFPALKANAPIGVFDSGLGGLSVLRHVRECLPHEDLLYFADTGFAPYGGRPEAEIVARSIAIAEFLLERGAKALVVACNTATAAAIKGLRQAYPELPLVGVEPGLKPAAATTKSGIVGVMATKFTVNSDKFAQLREQISAATQVRFLPQACVGLADKVEKGELESAETIALIKSYVTPLIEQGADTLVLGCTHYPFVQNLIEACIREATDRHIAIIDTSEAVARQLMRLLAQYRLERNREHGGVLEGFTTADAATLSAAFVNLLKMQPPIMAVNVEHNLNLIQESGIALETQI